MADDLGDLRSRRGELDRLRAAEKADGRNPLDTPFLRKRLAENIEAKILDRFELHGDPAAELMAIAMADFMAAYIMDGEALRAVTAE